MSHSGKMIKIAVLVACAVVLSAGAASAILGLGKYEKVKAANGVVSIPLAKVGDGRTHFYKFESDGKSIVFFLVKADDGSIKSAFDACEVCYHEKKGYEQQQNSVVCKNCNKKFAISRIGPHETGGCNPCYLPHKEAGGSVIISVEDIKAGARFF
jgi:uncharacterized membrane protein